MEEDARMCASLAWHCPILSSGDIPLVFIHGWCCEGGQFAELAASLSRAYRVYCPDLPGHGRTALGTFQPGFANYADALAAWITDRQLDRPILVGHSMGGALALMAATRVPVRAVINLDGSLPAAPSTLQAQARIRQWLDLPDFRQRLAEALRDGFFLPDEQGPQAEEIVHSMISAPEDVLRFLPETIHTLDAARILPRLRMPVLYIGAQNPRFDAAAVKALRPDVPWKQIPNSGHFLHLYAPGKVAELIEAFLNPPGTGA